MGGGGDLSPLDEVGSNARDSRVEEEVQAGGSACTLGEVVGVSSGCDQTRAVQTLLMRYSPGYSNSWPYVQRLPELCGQSAS